MTDRGRPTSVGYDADAGLSIFFAGDSRGLVLHRNGTFTVLSKDHKPTQVAERLRIKNAGGFLLRRVGVWRVDGRLALSRAFGDFVSALAAGSLPSSERMRLLK